MEGLSDSSSKYKRRKEGKAIKIKVIVGRIVQITSIVWPSRSRRLVNLLKNNDPIIYDTIIVIMVRINNVWSWKKISCSIRGEALFWKFKLAQVAITNKSINLYIWDLNPMHFSAILEIWENRKFWITMFSRRKILISFNWTNYI